MPLFKNIVLYRIGPEWSAPTLEVLETAMQPLAFVPCTPTQEHAAGWVPPRGNEAGTLVETVDGQWILELAIERKAVPGAAVRTELEARCKALEAERGRKPGRKEKADIKQDIVHAFLPRAFSKRSAHRVWLDAGRRCVVVAAGSMKAAEPAIKALVDVMAAVGHVIPLSPVATAMAPATAMGEWLTSRQAPVGFTIDRDLELKKPGEEKSVVRYARHSLELEEIGQHIQEGKLPTQLALTWNDKVSFVLTEQLSIRKIDIRDVEKAPKGEDGFDADVAIATGELARLLPDLLESLGGELEHAAAPA